MTKTLSIKESAMTLYLINGTNFDPVEWCNYSVAKVCKTREEAEAKLELYIADARSFLASCFDGDHTEYTEDLNSRNGHPIRYRVNLICDMTDNGQRSVYIDTISAGFISEDMVAWDVQVYNRFKELRLVDITIKEIEL